MTPRRKTLLVVKSGRVEFRRENRREGGAKIDKVPVPVRSGRIWPEVMIRRIRSRYWYSSVRGISNEEENPRVR